MIDQKLQRLINRFIELNWKRFEDDYDSHAREIHELTNEDFEFRDIIEGIFVYIMDQNEDPTEYFYDNDLNKYFYESEIFSILVDSGWVDRKFNIDRYRPIKEGRNKGKNQYGDIIWEGDKIYLLCDNWMELSKLFGKDEQDTVERVLSEDWSELYSWFDVDFDNDVWDNLDEESLRHIKEYIIENDFIGKELDYDEDPDGEGLRLDMLEDNSLLGELIDNEHMFDELKRELENYYRWAYEGAAEDELFKEMSDEIKQLLGSDGEWYTMKPKTPEGKDQHYLRFDITDKFMEFNRSYLECFALIPEEQESFFLSVIAEYLDCDDEELRGPDMNYFYPDHRKVAEHLNYNVLGNL